MEVDAFLLGGIHLPGVRGHFFSAFQAGQVNFLTQTHRTAGTIDGDITATKYQHAVT